MANFSNEQTQAALNNSLFTVAVFENNQAIGMGRLIGGGMYQIIADIVVRPAYQKRGLRAKLLTNLWNTLLKSYLQRYCLQKSEKCCKCTNTIFAACLLSAIIRLGLV